MRVLQSTSTGAAWTHTVIEMDVKYLYQYKPKTTVRRSYGILVDILILCVCNINMTQLVCLTVAP